MVPKTSKGEFFFVRGSIWSICHEIMVLKFRIKFPRSDKPYANTNHVSDDLCRLLNNPGARNRPSERQVDAPGPSMSDFMNHSNSIHWIDWKSVFSWLRLDLDRTWASTWRSEGRSRAPRVFWKATQVIGKIISDRIWLVGPRKLDSDLQNHDSETKSTKSTLGQKKNSPLVPLKKTIAIY